MHTTRNSSDRPRRKNDYYPTPYGLAKTSLQRVIEDHPIVFPGINGVTTVLDAGCGRGVWTKAMQEVVTHSKLKYPSALSTYGIDLELPVDSMPDTFQGDFLDTVASTYRTSFDMIYGNPPYGLMEQFVLHSLESDLLNYEGLVFFMCRLEFLASRVRYEGLFKKYPPKNVYVLSRRPSFFSTNGHRTTDAQDYAMYLWQKGWRRGGLVGATELSWLYWDYDPVHDVITEIDPNPNIKKAELDSMLEGMSLERSTEIYNVFGVPSKHFVQGEIYIPDDPENTVFVDLDNEQD